MPPPRLHLIRYHGVLAPHAAERAQIVPAPSEAPSQSLARSHGACPCRLSWARLLARLLRVDGSRCPACGGPLRILAALTDPDSLRTYLHGVGLDCRPPPLTPARLAPQPELEFAA